MNPKAPQLLAGATNVGMDLAQGHEWVLDAMSTIRRRLPGCSILPTSDERLRTIDFQALSFELAVFELAVPIIATPREIVRKFFQ
jgi:hypothetical protein